MDFLNTIQLNKRNQSKRTTPYLYAYKKINFRDIKRDEIKIRLFASFVFIYRNKFYRWKYSVINIPYVD